MFNSTAIGDPPNVIIVAHRSIIEAVSAMMITYHPFIHVWHALVTHSVVGGYLYCTFVLLVKHIALPPSLLTQVFYRPSYTERRVYCINGMVSVASLCFPLNNLLLSKNFP